MNSQVNTKRIAKNTIILYLRMFLTMGISLYFSRLILQILGETDVGIYNVVGGIVTFSTVITGSISSAITRFITFELGTGDREKLKKIFATSRIIQMLLALVSLLIMEPLGIWFIETQLNIPSERLTAAHWVFQFSMATFVVTLLSTSYNALIMAHERMTTFAYISITTEVLKLLAGFLIVFLPFDNLVVYGFFMFLIVLFARVFYHFYCRKNFAESKAELKFNRQIFKEMLSLAGWNTIGASSYVFRQQGVNVLLNIFFNAAVNAAHSLATQVFQAINSLASAIHTAINPQITKSYAAKETENTFRLIFMGVRYSSFLMIILAVPILIEANFIISLWLKDVPQYTVVFTRLFVILCLLENISTPLITLMLATGNIRKYQIIVGGLQLSIFFISALLLYLGFSPESTIISAIIISQIMLFARLILLRGMTNFPHIEFLRNVYLPLILLFFGAMILPFFVFNYCDLSPTWRFLCVGGISVISSSVLIFFYGCKANERKFVFNKIKKCLKL